MHAARVAHGRMNATHVMVDGTTVSIADFEFASSAAGHPAAAPPTSPSSSSAPRCSSATIAR